MDESFSWYIFRVKSGTEDIAVDYIQSEFQDEVDFSEVYVPYENENLLEDLDVSNGLLKKKEKRGKKLLLGYVFIKMKATDVFLKKVLTIPNIYRIRQSSNDMLQIVTDEEVAKIRQGIKNYDNRRVDSNRILSGDFILVNKGSFSGLKGVVKQVLGEKVVVAVQMFGRVTEINVLIVQIVKVDKRERG